MFSALNLEIWPISTPIFGYFDHGPTAAPCSPTFSTSSYPETVAFAWCLPEIASPNPDVQSLACWDRVGRSSSPMSERQRTETVPPPVKMAIWIGRKRKKWWWASGNQPWRAGKSTFLIDAFLPSKKKPPFFGGLFRGWMWMEWSTPLFGQPWTTPPSIHRTVLADLCLPCPQLPALHLAIFVPSSKLT